MPRPMDILPFRGPQKKAPRLDLISPYGFADSETYQPDAQQSPPAVSAQPRAGGRAVYYHHHGDEHAPVARYDETAVLESAYAFVSPSECAAARAEGPEAESPVSGGKGFRFPRIKLSLTASPPKLKPKKQPQTPRSAISFGRGGAGNSFRSSSNTSPPSPTAMRRHKSSNSDPTSFEWLSTHTDHTDATLATLDYSSDADTYVPSRLQVGLRASRWSVEPLRDQEFAGRSSLESEWKENVDFERHQHATPLELPIPTGYVGMKAISASLPNISPNTGRLRWEEEDEIQDARVTFQGPGNLPSPSLAREFSHISGDPRLLRSFSPLDLGQLDAPFPSALSHHLKNPPPSYDEATDHLAPMYGPRDRGHLDEPHLYAAYDAHHRTCQTSRPLPTIPRRHDHGRTTPMEPVYPNHSKEGQSAWLHRQSMKKSPLTVSAASARPDHVAQYTLNPLYSQDPDSSESFHTREYHSDDGREHDLDEEHPDEYDITPRPSLESRYQRRSSTPTVEPMRDLATLTEPPDHGTETPTAPQMSVVTASGPPSPLQGEPDRLEGTQPKQLSKMERALLRQALHWVKADNVQLQRS